MNGAEIKRAVSISTALIHYGSTQDAHGRWRCLFSANHHHGDCHHSVDTKNGRAKCWSQGCFGERGVDVFSLVGLMEGLTNFADQKRRVCEIGGLTENSVTQARKIIRCYRWEDTEGRVAWHLRWEPGKPKFTWSQDARGKRAGRGECAADLYQRAAVVTATEVILCEGEHDAEALNEFLKTLKQHPNTVATCTPNGASDVKAEYLMPLFEKACVWLSGQNDGPGQEYPTKCHQGLYGKVPKILSLPVPDGVKDWAEWSSQGATAEIFKALLDQAQPYIPSASANPTPDGSSPNSPWAAAQSAPEFLHSVEADIDWLVEDLLAPGSITEIFCPRGVGKTHVAHALAVQIVKSGKKVLLIDRDNSRHEVKRRLRGWGADDLQKFMILTREKAPPLTDERAWAAFPYQDYALAIIDSLDASSEGVGEKDSAKPSRAIAPLLDIAHRENGPAILVLGNTIKSGEHSRGSGVVEDRADICFEVRDATGLQPTGTKDWWLELPQAGVGAWGDRATRRKRKTAYQLAFIPSKFRIGEEPEPFILEIDLSDEPWTLRDVTQEVVQTGEAARGQTIQDRQTRLDKAAQSLSHEVQRYSATNNPMLTDKEAIPFLQKCDLTREQARQVLKDSEGRLWKTEQRSERRGRPKVLVPMTLTRGESKATAAENNQSQTPQSTIVREGSISADRMDTERRKSVSIKPLSAEEFGGHPLFPRNDSEQPPYAVEPMPEYEEFEV